MKKLLWMMIVFFGIGISSCHKDEDIEKVIDAQTTTVDNTTDTIQDH